MTENEFDARLEALETRAAHQEASIEELTRTLLEQEKRVRVQEELIQRLEAQVRAMSASPVGAPQDETPPPHY